MTYILPFTLNRTQNSRKIIISDLPHHHITLDSDLFLIRSTQYVGNRIYTYLHYNLVYIIILLLKYNNGPGWVSYIISYDVQIRQTF